MWIACGFGAPGYLMQRVGMSPLPFFVAFILAAKLEDTARQVFVATGGDAWFLFTHPLATAFMATAMFVVAGALRETSEVKS
jgi:putative tricarboxylic transport membrane protein